MKTKYKYIRFEEFYEGHWNIWNNRTKDLLGDIRFYDKWKEWELRLERGVAFTKECLLDVVDFIKQLENKKDDFMFDEAQKDIEQINNAFPED